MGAAVARRSGVVGGGRGARLASYAGYVALHGRVRYAGLTLIGWRESYLITMAGVGRGSSPPRAQAGSP